MHDISIVDGKDKAKDVATLVNELLTELEPSASEELSVNEQVATSAAMKSLASNLLQSSKIWAFVAVCNEKSVAVITLHECAALYAGGIFGEISELYVKPEFRSSNIGDRLITAAIEKGKELGWKRLEVGTPAPNESPRTIRFYQKKGFISTGMRLKLLI